jgi:hypothetical protein
MNKTELLNLCDLKELKTYEATAEYKKIIKDCSAKEKMIRDEILAAYRSDEELDRFEMYDFHDKQFAYVEFLIIMLEKVKSKSR